ncbi:MAG: polyisoprenoid-binding protein YceI [Bacteroidia bacterium]|jgi:polyisoprenoid-binding protein YceI
MTNSKSVLRGPIKGLCGVFFAALLLTASSAWAQWELNSDHSAINFVSIKNGSVGEVHSFASLVGFIGAGGNAQLTIDLDSVSTLIPIRNERLRELLFETVKFPAAKITAQVEPAVLAAAAEGGIITADLSFILSLHGLEKKLMAPIAIVGEGEGLIRVYSTRPILINAADFGLDGGIEALRAIAGLKDISTSVPVTLSLSFRPAK